MLPVLAAVTVVGLLVAAARHARLLHCAVCWRSYAVFRAPFHSDARHVMALCWRCWREKGEVKR